MENREGQTQREKRQKQGEEREEWREENIRPIREMETKARRHKSSRGECGLGEQPSRAAADEDRPRWRSLLILWCHSKVLKAELKVDKEAVVKGLCFLQPVEGGWGRGAQTTDRCILVRLSSAFILLSASGSRVEEE